MVRSPVQRRFDCASTDATVTGRCRKPYDYLALREGAAMTLQFGGRHLFVRHAPFVRRLVLALARGGRAGTRACRVLVRVAQWLAAPRL